MELMTGSILSGTPTNVAAVQIGTTCILVSWSPSSDATGYMIHYNSSGGHNGSEGISDGSTTNYTLCGLQSGQNYTLVILATSQDFPSRPQSLFISLSEL